MPLSIRFTLRPLAILGIDPFRGAGIADLALFSLAPGSPSLGIMDPFLGRPLSGADVFVTDFDGTFALYATAESMGLSFADNVDGLDVQATPEPSSLLLALLALLAFGGARLHFARAGCATARRSGSRAGAVVNPAG
jgi:hypothetical protein